MRFLPFFFLAIAAAFLIYNEYRCQQNYRETLHKYYECTNLKTYHKLKPITPSQYKTIFPKHSGDLFCREMQYTKQYVDLLQVN